MVPKVVRSEPVRRAKCYPSGALVAVGQGMVLGEPHDEDCGLVDELGIEVGVAESGGWCVQSGVGKVEVCDGHDRVDIEAGYSGGDRDEVGQVEILDGHCARRSSNSRSWS